MRSRKLHLTAPAASCQPFLEALHIDSARELKSLAQEAVGPAYVITGDEALIEAGEDDDHGGRDDDERRAQDLEQALADPEVAAIVAVRGGAWFTRILPRIDFTVLDRRPAPVAVFGFSELTTLINLIATYPMGRGVYDMGPAFLPYGLKRYARTQPAASAIGESKPEEWARARLEPEVRGFFDDVVSMIKGHGSARPVTAELVRGELADQVPATFVGGNLTVLTTLLGTPYQRCVTPAQQWLIIEDLNEKPERIDRMLAHLTLAGAWEDCAGLMLGDFHKDEQELTPAVLELLDHHLPPDQPMPVLTTPDVGHVWPMSPLPLHLPLTLMRLEDREFAIEWPGSLLDVR
ncbi:MAG: LD-carboxypeptidase [Planctomycetes bacterium]|nr:LD-carboxypeptidase [Planctomycetota bacterium]